MPRPRYCRNPDCENCYRPEPGFLVRNGTYRTRAHATVQRYKCSRCGCGLSAQTESMYYHSKRRIDFGEVFSRLRGGSSQRDIARELGCSRTAVGTAMLRLGRQAMSAQMVLLCGFGASRRMCFDGLVSALASRDYATQISVLADTQRELILAMTHCTTQRGGSRTDTQKRRIRAKRTVWQAKRGAFSESIRLLVHELARFASPAGVHIDTDEHPLYARILATDLAMRWFREAALLSVRRTPGTAPRTPDNPLFLINYLDRMIRHRMKEHTRESIALGRNASAQMHRMWIFAWDHNTRQPRRVGSTRQRSRAEAAGLSQGVLDRLKREFTTRRFSLRGLFLPESIRSVWTAALDSPPVRWRTPQKTRGPRVPAFALRDLSFACPHAQ